VKLNVLDTGLAQRELSWSPRIALDEGLARTADWIRRSLP
jgi:nucleoside-diphosphate-sugar epimerase